MTKSIPSLVMAHDIGWQGTFEKYIGIQYHWQFMFLKVSNAVCKLETEPVFKPKCNHLFHVIYSPPVWTRPNTSTQMVLWVYQAESLRKPLPPPFKNPFFPSLDPLSLSSTLLFAFLLFPPSFPSACWEQWGTVESLACLHTAVLAW